MVQNGNGVLIDWGYARRVGESGCQVHPLTYFPHVQVKLQNPIK
jgi:hypothetical protein